MDTRRFGTLQLQLLCVLSILLAPASNAQSSPPLIVNEDNSHFFGFRTADDMTLAGLQAFVDQYAGTKVTHLFLCPNAMRASYASHVRDAIWDIGSQEIPPNSPVAQHWVDNARLLNERGLDPYAVWIARCREKGISPWLSMRMNDVHDVDNVKNFMHSTFWLNHPDYWRVPGSKGSWVDRALDYGIPAVREYNMALLRELLERYDADGIELDWMRFGYHFKPGAEAEGREILNTFMRDARALTQEWSQKRGHSIKLGARVPAHPDAAYGLGMDGVAWAREGLVDLLVPTPFWATADFDIPVELWKERIGDAKSHVQVIAGIEILLRGYPSGQATENDLASTRGCAAAALQRGSDGVYLFNYMDPAPMQGGNEAYRALLEQGVSSDFLASQSRRYVITYRDTVPAGVSAGTQLPAQVAGGPILRMYVAPVPDKEKAAIVLGFQEETPIAELSAIVNGQPCSAATLVSESNTIPGAKAVLSFDCPNSSLHAGYNEFKIQSSNPGHDATIVWAEVRTNPTQ